MIRVKDNYSYLVPAVYLRSTHSFVFKIWRNDRRMADGTKPNLKIYKCTGNNPTLFPQIKMA
jgi:hypothetical protein